MTKKHLNIIGYCSAILTFLIASSIMFAHYNGFHGDFEGYGIIFIPIAFLINFSVLILILILAERKKIKGPFRSIGAMLFNIPVAFFYIWFAMYLSSYFRVTVMNDTSSRISVIQIDGCDKKYINELEAGESETIWIKISSDCSLSIAYLDKNGKIKHDQIMGYLCTGMGRPEDFHISGRNNPK